MIVDVLRGRRDLKRGSVDIFQVWYFREFPQS